MDKKILKWVFLSLNILYSNILFALTPIENKILSTIDQHKEAQILFLKKLVNTNTGTSNKVGVNNQILFLKNELLKLGFKTKIFTEPKNFHRGATLIATHEGKIGKKILLIAHIDTVFNQKEKFNHFIRKDNLAYGPGVIDDKGGIVVLIEALKALKQNDVLKNRLIKIVITGDEEDSGKPNSISRKPLIDAARHLDIALDFEPAVTLNTLTIGRRGISDWTIHTYGNESHSATIFQKDVGIGAILEMARILNAMRMQITKDDLIFNPGLIAGGTQIGEEEKSEKWYALGKQNVVASVAIAKGDFRYLNQNEKNDFLEKVKKIIDQSFSLKKSTIEMIDGIPPMQPTIESEELLKQYNKVSIDLGFDEVTSLDPRQRGAADIAYVSQVINANLSGLGPLGFGEHSIRETIDLSSLPIQTKRAAILIYRLIQSD